jgi:hypothetical protein
MTAKSDFTGGTARQRPFVAIGEFRAGSVGPGPPCGIVAILSSGPKVWV